MAPLLQLLQSMRVTLPALTLQGGLKKESADEEPMQTDLGESSYTPGAEEKPLYTAEPLSLDDLKLLSDLFYLPYEHGPTARTMLQELDWLKNHSAEEVSPALLEPVSPAAPPYACSFFLFPDGRVALQSSAL